MKFWLIQRGKFNPFNPQITGLTGRNGLINLDYMGSSEFEFGAIPCSYRRIMSEFGKYTVIQTKLKNKNGVPLNVFCHTDKKVEIQEALTEYIANPYHLKECSGFESFATSYGARTNFWWEIENGIDFMFFYGAQDRISQFTKIITNDYNTWWMAKEESVRKEESKKAFGYMW